MTVMASGNKLMEQGRWRHRTPQDLGPYFSCSYNPVTLSYGFLFRWRACEMEYQLAIHEHEFERSRVTASDAFPLPHVLGRLLEPIIRTLTHVDHAACVRAWRDCVSTLTRQDTAAARESIRTIQRRRDSLRFRVLEARSRPDPPPVLGPPNPNTPIYKPV